MGGNTTSAQIGVHSLVKASSMPTDIPSLELRVQKAKQAQRAPVSESGEALQLLHTVECFSAFT